MLVHLVDLDSEAHDNAPFTPEALAILEYTDELIGTMMQDMPNDYAVVIVSDHGFERLERMVNLNALANQHAIKGVRPRGGIVVADNSEADGFLRALQSDPQYGIGRSIPKEEILHFSPALGGAAAVFESAPGVWFAASNSGEVFSKPPQMGEHGHWPTRYRSVYLMWGPGIRSQHLPEISMKDIAQRLAALLEVPFKPAPRH